MVTVLEPGWARRYIPHQGPKDHLTPKRGKKFQLLIWPLLHSNLLGPGWAVQLESDVIIVILEAGRGGKDRLGVWD